MPTCPARSGHAVTLILLDDEPVGMFNLDAAYRVNFARADPTLLLRPVDAALVVFGALASIVASALTGKCQTGHGLEVDGLGRGRLKGREESSGLQISLVFDHRVARRPATRRQAFGVLNGFRTCTSKFAKSATLRVTTVSL